VTTATAHDLDDALAAAEAAGYPVVLKTADPDIHHKLDVDGVRLRLGDSAAVAAAYADLAARLGPSVSVQPEVPEGVEVALGLWRDRLLGPLVLVAAGGSLVELLAERSVALPPVDADTAGRLVNRLRLSQLLAGHRGRPPLAADALVDAVVAFSQLCHELGDLLEAVDVNPLVVGEQGVVVVDALVVPR
jgi:acyl-CoA synthetase (NDP forming)